MSGQLVADNVAAFGNGLERQPFIVGRVPQCQVELTGRQFEACCCDGLAANIEQFIADLFDMHIDVLTGLRIEQTGLVEKIGIPVCKGHHALRQL